MVGGVMFVHTVYFWLREDLTEEQRKAFKEEGIDSLKKIEAAYTVYTGSPAQTDRPVIDRTYDFGLTVVLEDLQHHDYYQVDPIHKEFVEKFGDYWTKVTIYDAEG